MPIIKKDSSNNPLCDIDPKVDVSFKYVLSSPEILIGLLNDILSAVKLPKVKHIQLVNGELTKEKIMEKGATLDILATTDNKANINIELQYENHGGYIERLLFHWSKIHISHFQKGNKYNNIISSPTIIISISNFACTKEKNPINHYRLLNNISHLPLKKDLVHLIFIELPKFKQISINPESVEYWMAYYKNEKKFEKYIKGYKMTQLASQKLNKMRQENSLLSAYHDHLALLNDEEFKLQATRIEAKEEGIKEGMKEGVKEGIKEGMKEGIKEGKDQGKIEIIKLMLNNNMSVKEISKITSMPMKFIEKCK